MSELVVGVGAMLGAGALAYGLRQRRLRGVARERLLSDGREEAPAVEEHVAELSPVLRRRRLLPPLAGVLAGAGLAWLGLATVYALAGGVIVCVLAHLVESQLAARRTLKLEVQLADGLDLMVAALSAGSGVIEALEGAVREGRSPFREELGETVGRLRLGHPPAKVYGELAERVPLDNFRLFASTLAVNGEVGGSVAPALATVGRSIRDRIEVTRRAASQSAQAQFSVVGVLLITWFLGLLMWRTNPDAFTSFLLHPLGSTFVAGAVVLQAVGLVWITRLARVRF